MSDTDSDNTALSNNIYTFQNRDMTVSARGPNVPNMTSLSFRSNMMSSKQMFNFDKYRYAPPAYDQRMMYSRRETSPASMRSEILPRTFDRPFYHRGMSSQRSLVNGRSGSPMSMSIASSASVSAADIAMAFKNAEFSKRDLQMITDAYKKYMKRRIRKKFEKRRRLRLFIKGNRQGSGGESGEQGSDSSLSNDDCISVRSSTFKENLLSCRSTNDIGNITKNTYQGNNNITHRDYPENCKEKSFRNMFTVASSKLVPNKTKSNSGQLLQKDRFKNGFLLPSQRFDNSLASVTIPEHTEKNHENKLNYSTRSTANNLKPINNVTQTSDSDQEEIFSRTVRNNSVEKLTTQKKTIGRNIQTTNKISPIKKIQCVKPIKANNCVMDDFVFAKPAFPVKKSTNVTKEKVIAKSAPIIETDNLECEIEPPQINQDEHNETTQSSISDMSSKPSFIKRKLFTQKLDDKNNISSDNLVNSPQTVYGKIQKEKNKIRKLVTSQSCLNTDLLGEDNNYLDLIHKIVPADKLNLTTQTIKSKVKNKKLEESDDKWDVASVLSVCNNDSLSDTYTDEEIFAEDNNKYKNVEKSNNKTTEITKEINTVPKNFNVNNPIKKNCKIVLEKIQPVNEVHEVQQAKLKNQDIHPGSKNGTKTNNIKSCVKSFWDTDIESDMETFMAPKKKKYSEEMVKLVTSNATETISDKIDEKYKENDMPQHDINTTIQRNVTVNLQRFNTKNFRVKSHRDPSAKKCLDSKETTTKNNLLHQNEAKKLNSQNNLKPNIENPAKIPINPISTNTNRKRKSTTPIKKTAKKAKIVATENDLISPKDGAKQVTRQKQSPKTKKNSKEKTMTLQKPVKSPKTVKLKTELTVKNKNSTDTVEVNKYIKNTNTQKKGKTTNKENVKTDIVSNSNVSVKNGAKNKANISNISVKRDRTLNMTLRSRNSLSKSFSPVLNNSRTRRQINKYK